MSGLDNIHGRYKVLLRKFDDGTITDKENKLLVQLEEMLGEGQTFGPASHVRHYKSIEDADAGNPYAITEIDFVTGEAERTVYLGEA